MAPHERSHKTASRHDFEAAPAAIVESGANVAMPLPWSAGGTSVWVKMERSPCSR